MACDSYHQYQADVELLKQMGVSQYRFSISWARVLPNGVGEPNPQGIQYYKNLINSLGQSVMSYSNQQTDFTLYDFTFPITLIGRLPSFHYNRGPCLVDAGISPAVTLYHWDLPQALQERGGWLTEEVADWFEEYADLCFREFGDIVKFWITLNEPRVTSLGGDPTIFNCDPAEPV